MRSTICAYISLFCTCLSILLLPISHYSWPLLIVAFLCGIGGLGSPYSYYLYSVVSLLWVFGLNLYVPFNLLQQQSQLAKMEQQQIQLVNQLRDFQYQQRVLQIQLTTLTTHHSTTIESKQALADLALHQQTIHEGLDYNYWLIDQLNWRFLPEDTLQTADTAITANKEEIHVNSDLISGTAALIGDNNALLPTNEQVAYRLPGSVSACPATYDCLPSS